MSLLTLPQVTISRPAARRRYSVGWNILIFLASIAVFEGLVDRVASPFQGAEKVARKFAYLAAHINEYDFVFVGSSRVMNQISPHVFDAEMAAAGRPCRSFNLGVAAMFLPECVFLLDQIRALHPQHLRGMVIELSSPAPRHDLEHPLTDRDIYWHRVLPTLLACAALWTDPEARATPTERIAQVCLQTTICARCIVHLGDGPLLLERLRKGRSRYDNASAATVAVVGPARDGFFPLEHTLGRGEAGESKSGGGLSDLLTFQNAANRLRAEITAATLPDMAVMPASIVARTAFRVQQAVIAHEVAALRREGTEPVFFIGPGTTREQCFLNLYAQGTVPKLLAFNDPDVYPDLYVPEVRADRNHLNAAGAEQLSRRLARIMAAEDVFASDHARR